MAYLPFWKASTAIPQDPSHNGAFHKQKKIPKQEETVL